MTSLVYITAADDNLIRVYEMDSAGRLTPRMDVSVPGGPGALTTGANGQFLYCSLRNSRELAAFRFENDGGLRPLGRQALDADSCYIAVDKTNRFLLAAYYRAGKATVHRLEADGSVGPLVCTAHTADRAHCIETDASNSYAYVPHPVDRQLHLPIPVQRGERSTGAHPAAPAGGRGSRGRSPSLRLLSRSALRLHSNEDGSSVTAYQVAAAPNGDAQSERGNGALKAFQTLSTLPQEFSGKTPAPKSTCTRQGELSMFRIGVTTASPSLQWTAKAARCGRVDGRRPKPYPASSTSTPADAFSWPPGRGRAEWPPMPSTPTAAR